MCNVSIRAARWCVAHHPCRHRRACIALDVPRGTARSARATACNAAGQVVLKLKTAWRDGTTHLVMSLLEFMQWLAVLVPRSGLAGWSTRYLRRRAALRTALRRLCYRNERGAPVRDFQVQPLSCDLVSASVDALLPQVVHAVKVPVIAAGGIADARGVAAAMALGAREYRLGLPICSAPKPP